MRTSLRATIAVALSLGAVLVAATIASPAPSAAQETTAGSSTPPPDGGQSVPGWDGTGEPPVAVPADPPPAPCDVISSSDKPDAPVASCPQDPGGDPGSEPTPSIVEPRPGMAGVYARAFDTATVGDDDRTVRIDFVGGVEPCYVLDHVDVSYGADAVTITLFDGHDPQAGDVACIDIGVFQRVVVTLDEPLGGRAIVDGAADASA